MGLINVMSIILPYLKKQQKGHIAMISSLAGFFGLQTHLVTGQVKLQ